MEIVATERVPVAFEGDGAGTGELSWGQQAVWKGMTDSGDSLTMTAVRELGPGATVEEFVFEYGFYLGRYQAMRTLLRFGPDGRARQVVHASGTAEIEIYDARGGDQFAERRVFRCGQCGKVRGDVGRGEAWIGHACSRACAAWHRWRGGDGFPTGLQ